MNAEGQASKNSMQPTALHATANAGHFVCFGSLCKVRDYGKGQSQGALTADE